MARSYANVATAIWRDDQFRNLSMAAQHAYLLLISQPDISAAGILSLSLTRWAARTKDATRADMRAAVDELEANGFVVVDDDTEELLVRSFVRWDGGHTNSKRRPVIRDAAAGIESKTLRKALAVEFARLGLPSDWLPEVETESPQVDSLSDSPPDTASDRPPDSPPDTASASERVVGTKGEYLRPPTPNPQSTTRVPPPAPPGAPRASARERGTRLPDDFRLTDEMVAWGRQHAPGVDGRYETEKFIDYWRAKTGKDATKLDWIGTWRNWVRTAGERAGPARGRAATGANRHTRQRHDNPFAEQP